MAIMEDLRVAIQEGQQRRGDVAPSEFDRRRNSQRAAGLAFLRADREAGILHVGEDAPAPLEIVAACDPDVVDERQGQRRRIGGGEKVQRLGQRVATGPQVLGGRTDAVERQRLEAAFLAQQHR